MKKKVKTVHPIEQDNLENSVIVKWIFAIIVIGIFILLITHRWAY